MRWGMLLWVLAAAAATISGKAEACVYTGVLGEEIGPKRTAREIAADQEIQRREMLRQATLEAQKRLAGGADAPGELAEMLVPNIQAVFLERSSCGDGEVDWAGSDDSAYAPLTGTPLAGRENEFHAIVSDYGPGKLEPDCNAEFRGRFAEHLRRRLPPVQLEQSYIFLAARRPDALRRLMAFGGRERRPPVHWVGDSRISAWARRHPTGQALSAAIAGFWRETTPLLANAESSCPAAFTRWKQSRDALVARDEEALRPQGQKP